MWIEQQADALGRVCDKHPGIQAVLIVVAIFLCLKLLAWACK